MTLPDSTPPLSEHHEIPLGLAGRLAHAFINSPLTPLIVVASIVQGLSDVYVHAGGQFEWDSAAPVAVALAAALAIASWIRASNRNAGRVDGSVWIALAFLLSPVCLLAGVLLYPLPGSARLLIFAPAVGGLMGLWRRAAGRGAVVWADSTQQFLARVMRANAGAPVSSSLPVGASR